MSIQLTCYMRKLQSRVKVAGRRAALDVCIRIVAAITTLDITTNKVLQLLVRDGRYLLEGRYCTYHTVHSDFEVQEGWIQRVLAVITRSGAMFLLVCPVSHTYVHCPMAEKNQLSKMLFLEKVDIQVFSIFVGYGYMQLGGCD